MEFNDEELDVIREILSAASCGHVREEFYHHCCDVREIVERIDKERR